MGLTVPRFTNTRRQTGPPAGKRGMVRAGGSASRTISDDNTPDPDGGHHPVWKRPKDDTHGPRWTPDAHGFPSLGSLTPAEKDRRDHTVLDRAPAMVERNSHLDFLGRHPAPLGRFVKTPRRRIRPAGNNRSARWGTPGRRNDTMRSSAVRPLSVEAAEISPALAPEQKLLSGRKTRSSGAGGVVPSVVAEPPLPTAGGGGGDVHGGSEGSRIGHCERRGQVVRDTDLGKVPAILSAPPGDTLVNQPKMYSAQKIDLDGIPMEEVVVLEPLAFSAPGGISGQ